MNLNEEFTSYYKVFKTSNSIDSDIKLIKKINNLISKWLKFEKDHYKLEILNILKINENIFNVNSSFMGLIRDNFIEEQYLPIFNNLYRECYEQLQNNTRLLI